MIGTIVFAKYLTDLNKMYLKNTSTYQVRAMYIPLFCDQVGTLTRALDLTHAGLGFVDEATGEEFTIEYNINPINYTFNVIDAIRPVAKYNEKTKLYDFIWDFQILTFMQDFINKSECGWEKQVVIASGASGKAINEMTTSFGKKFGEDNHIYKLFEFWWADNRERFGGLRSTTCQDFMWWAIQDLAKRGVKFNGKLTQRLRLHFNLDREYAAPRLLNESDRADNQLIFDFYERFNQVAAEYSDTQLVDAVQSGEIYRTIRARWSDVMVITPLDTGFWTATTDEFFFGINNELEKVPGTD